MKKFAALFGVVVLLDACKSTAFTGASNRSPALPPIQARDFVQDTREVRQVQVKQGSSGSNANENYNVTAMGIVDIVVVVDNSGSMAEEQKNLSSRMVPLLSAIKDSDWRIVVVSTDANNEYFRGPISKSTYNYESVFSRYVTDAGVNGSGLERPILRAVDALAWKPFSDGLFAPKVSWLRKDSTVAVIILTDEDNCHLDNEKGYACSGAADYNGSYLTNYLASIRKVGTDARVYGIFWHPSQSQAQCGTALKQANIINDVVTQTGGTWGSICDNDYSGTLSKISNDVAKTLKADFVLKSMPDPGTFRMTVNGQAWSEYTLSGLNVHFTRNPPVGAAVLVSYVRGASGVVTNKFEMPEAPADGVVTATISGQPAGPVTYDPATGQAIFSNTPPNNSTVVMSYKVNSPLKTIFEIAPGADTRYLKVYVNGAPVDKSGYSYDSATGAIKFQTAPPESAKVQAEWRGLKKTS